MPTLHIGSAVSEKTGTQVKGFSFIVMGDVGLISGMKMEVDLVECLLSKLEPQPRSTMHHLGRYKPSKLLKTSGKFKIC